MKEIYIAESARTAIGSFGGSLKGMSAAALGGIVIKEVLARAGVAGSEVDYVLMGNVLQAGQGQNPARQAELLGGIPESVPAMTLNKVCGSGLAAVNIAAAMIKAEQADCIVAGGMESMSRAPFALDMRWGQKMGNAQAVDTMISEGLWDVFNDYHMGITAENVAEEYGISREEQDELALASQQKATAAIVSGRFSDEIVPVSIPQRKGAPVLFDEDEFVRKDASLEALQKLRPAFKKDGTVTAGNASGLNDGAAAMLVVSEDFLKKHRMCAQARYITGTSVGVDPKVMGTGPIPTVKKAFELAGLGIDDMDLIEANEAFASQAIAVQRGTGAAKDKVNVNGGAIAMGHPIGASGARIAVTLLHELKKRDGKYGLATLCIGGGMGEAVIFLRDENCL